MPKIIILLFILLETGNVLSLYFWPENPYANGVGVFRAWQKSQSDPEMQRFARYMVNWVAGSKLIFLFLLVLILLRADAATLRLTAAAMALAIASFFWRLYPLIRQMGQAGELDPPRYDRTLAGMIAGMVAVFLLAAVL
ncbi:MAG: hypothetical protein Fur0018_23380 [Anaerolineales bacterium]